MSRELSNCIDTELGALLHGYELGTLQEADAARFEEHLVECEFCAAQLERTLSLQEYREEIVGDLRKTGDSFEAQFQRLKAQRTRPSGFILFLKSAYTRYVLAPAVAVAILTFFVVRDKAPVIQAPQKILTDIPSSHSTFVVGEPPADTARALAKPQLEAEEKSVGTEEQAPIVAQQQRAPELKAPPVATSSVPSLPTQRVAADEDAVIKEEGAQELSVEAVAGAEAIISTGMDTQNVVQTPQDVTLDVAAKMMTTTQSPLQDTVQAMGLFAPQADSAPQAKSESYESHARPLTSRTTPRSKVETERAERFPVNNLPAFRTTETGAKSGSLNAAKAYYQTGRYYQALDALDGVRKDSPNSGEASFYWGICRFMTADDIRDRQTALIEAEAALLKADEYLAATDTLKHWVHLFRAQVAYDRGEDAQALDFLKQLELAPPHLRARANLISQKLLEKTLPKK